MHSDPNASIPNRDHEHLRLLSIFHYVMAGLVALFGLFPVLYFGFGIALLSGTLEKHDPDARVAGGFLVVLAAVMLVFTLVLGLGLLYAGRSLAQRKNYVFCLVVAGISCLFAPLGTILGVFTLVVLMRDSVAASFGRPVNRPHL